MMPKPLDEFEMYELIVAAYPERFGGKEETDELYDEVLDFASETFGEEIYNLLGRVVMLAPTMESPLTGQRYHVLGTSDEAAFTAIVKREG